jgi:hypothetical protein
MHIHPSKWEAEAGSAKIHVRTPSCNALRLATIHLFPP